MVIQEYPKYMETPEGVFRVVTTEAEEAAARQEGYTCPSDPPKKARRGASDV